MEQNPNPAERNPNSDPQFPSPNCDFSTTCADPLQHFYLRPIPTAADVGLACSPGFVVGPSVFVPVPPASLSKRRAGAFFLSRTLGRSSSDLPAAEPHEREEGKRASMDQKPRTRAKDRPIDPTSGRNSPASPGPNRFRTNGQADGRQPFMPKSISQPLPSILIPSVSPIARRMRPLSVGRLENAFHPTTDHL